MTIFCDSLGKYEWLKSFCQKKYSDRLKNVSCISIQTFESTVIMHIYLYFITNDTTEKIQMQFSALM